MFIHNLIEKLKCEKKVPGGPIINGFIFEDAVFNEVKQKRCLSIYMADADISTN